MSIVLGAMGSAPPARDMRQPMISVHRHRTELVGLVFDMDGFHSPASGFFLAKYRLTPVRRVELHCQNTPHTWATSSRAMVKRTFPTALRRKISQNLSSI